MKNRVTVTQRALRQLVGEALDNTGWGVGDAMPGANLNPVVDSSAPATDPINPDFTPQDKVEFGVAINQLVKNLPNSDMPSIYATVKKALDQRSEKEEISDAKKQALVGGNQEAIDDATAEDQQKKHEGRHMTDQTVTEDTLRHIVRAALAHRLHEQTPQPVPAADVHSEDLDEEDEDLDEGRPGFNPSPAMTRAAKKMHQQKQAEKAMRASAKKFPANDRKEMSLDEEEDPADVAADEDEDEPLDRHGRPKKKHGSTKAFKSTALGSMNGEGATFQDIAKEFGFTVSAAKGAVDKAIDKLRFMKDMDPDEREIGVLSAMKDYINMLARSGELTGPDIELMKNHPNIVGELDGFREFLHNYVRRWRKGGGDAKISTFGEALEPGSVIKLKSAGAPKSSSPPKSAHTKAKGLKTGDDIDVDWGDANKTKAKTASGKDVEVDWGGLDEADEENLDERVESMIDCPRCGHTIYPNQNPKCGNCGKVVKSNKRNEVDETVRAARHRAQHTLTEVVGTQAVVMVDTRGPYVVVEGAVARPNNPNHTQYGAGAKVRCHCSGGKGLFVVQMPNGERWAAKKQMKG